MWKTLLVEMQDLLPLHNRFPPEKVLCVFSGRQLLHSTEKEEFKSSRPRLHSGMLPQCEVMGSGGSCQWHAGPSTGGEDGDGFVRRKGSDPPSHPPLSPSCLTSAALAASLTRFNFQRGERRGKEGDWWQKGSSGDCPQHQCCDELQSTQSWLLQKRHTSIHPHPCGGEASPAPACSSAKQGYRGEQIEYSASLLASRKLKADGILQRKILIFIIAQEILHFWEGKKGACLHANSIRFCLQMLQWRKYWALLCRVGLLY